MKNCPFCGKVIDINDYDTLYPSGDGWKDHGDWGRTYHSFKEVPKEQWCYVLNCACGASMLADSRQEAIDNWNMRV